MSVEYCLDDESTQDFDAEKTLLGITENLEKIRLIAEGEMGRMVDVADSDRSPEASDSCPKSQDGLGTKIMVHSSVMYFGDRLVLSTQTTELKMSKRDHDMFNRVVNCFTDMIMGTYTNRDVQNLRDDHDYLLQHWDYTDGGTRPPTETMSADDPRRALGDEIHKMIKNMLETPVYYTSSCMALIACGAMLRDLFKTTMKRDAENFQDLVEFVRRYIRHNPADPFECECPPERACSKSYKTLLSLILEIPPIILNQTYLLQILAYMMCNKEGREEIFIVNMKNVVSPGLLDKQPARMAMLVGSLDEKVIQSRMKRLLRETNGLNIGMGTGGGGGGGRTSSIQISSSTTKHQYSRRVLENIVMAVYDPRIERVIELLPGVKNATVELIFERCKDRRVCLNANNTGDINSPKDNNYGKNKCCGYLRLDPVAMLASSISMTQLCVYLWTDTRNAPERSRQHYFIRDIIVAMAKCSLNMDDESIEEIFGYLDRLDVFKGFANNPLFTKTFYRLFQAYLKSMKNVSNRIKTKRRKIDRVIKKMTEGNGQF